MTSPAPVPKGVNLSYRSLGSWGLKRHSPRPTKLPIRAQGDQIVHTLHSAIIRSQSIAGMQDKRALYVAQRPENKQRKKLQGQGQAQSQAVDSSSSTIPPAPEIAKKQARKISPSLPRPHSRSIIETPATSTRPRYRYSTNSGSAREEGGENVESGISGLGLEFSLQSKLSSNDGASLFVPPSPTLSTQSSAHFATSLSLRDNKPDQCNGHSSLHFRSLPEELAFCVLPEQIYADGWAIGYDDHFPKHTRLQQAFVFARYSEHENLYAHPLDFVVVIDSLAEKVVQIDFPPTYKRAKDGSAELSVSSTVPCPLFEDSFTESKRERIPPPVKSYNFLPDLLQAVFTSVDWVFVMGTYE
ncbi:hypothetical protein P692DRAFT_20880697 [Suillus brevipes Sb2]|nr:hypothetical protein P692DRAFT_20880697 [Suillus brevipes Sb2]